jgi:hypothetical protein
MGFIFAQVFVLQSVLKLFLLSSLQHLQSW